MKLKNKAKTTSAFSSKTLPLSEQPLHATKKMLIDADNITVKYGRDTPLKDVSLCVHQGEFIGLIGPNGAGKTTLLRVLLRLVKPATGHINYSGARIGYVPQRGNLYNSQIPMSVLEVVRLGARDGAAAIAALQRVAMDSFAHKPFTELSGGQQQRVAIAKALAGQPHILLLDEPTTGIDEASQHEFYDILRDLQTQGYTIIMVSHDVDAVLNLVTRVICLNQTVLYDGTPEHFESDKYLPGLYKAQHRLLHHHHDAHGQEKHHA
ncbi:MAG TPA: metal ABC transporter ATP-binding protein [Candidatus Saccharimonadales bacterium]|nr:metal ABC transporter ATP-binding protein [Candidatus Saccharimonadales bacterium]